MLLYDLCLLPVHAQAAEIMKLKSQLLEDERMAAEHTAQLAAASQDKSQLQGQVVRQQEELASLRRCVPLLVRTSMHCKKQYRRCSSHLPAGIHKKFCAQAQQPPGCDCLKRGHYHNARGSSVMPMHASYNNIQ